MNKSSFNAKSLEKGKLIFRSYDAQSSQNLGEEEGSNWHPDTEPEKVIDTFTSANKIPLLYLAECCGQ